jgi:hypothetical protein
MVIEGRHQPDQHVRAVHAAGSDRSGSLALPASPAVAGAVAAALLSFFVIVQRGVVMSYDGTILAGVARNIVEHGSLKVPAGLDYFGFNSPYASYGIGMSLLLVPFTAVQEVLSKADANIVTLANPMVLTATGVLLYLVTRELGLRHIFGVLAALGFGVLTLAPSQSTELFSEPWIGLSSVAFVLGAMLWRRANPYGALIAGAAVGTAILFRTDSVLTFGLGVASLLLFVPPRRLLTERRHTAAFLIPAGVAVCWVVFYNWLRYRSIASVGYAGQGFTTPLGEGLQIILVSAGKGFFWYNPVLLLALPGLAVLWRRDRAVTATILVLVASRILVVAKWSSPTGGVMWGPRLLFALCALLTIPAIAFVDQATRWRPVAKVVALAAAGALAIAGSFLTLLSVWVPYQQAFDEAASPRGIGQLTDAARQARVDSSLHRYYQSIGGGHIVANVHLLRRAAPFPLRHFAGHPSAIGILSVVVFLGSSVTALVAAVHRDRPAPEERAEADDPVAAITPVSP